MGTSHECQNGTDLMCSNEDYSTGKSEQDQKDADWIEEKVWLEFRMWHIIFLSAAAVLSLIILLCCCLKFRIPRTKQEIEGDYVRRKILRKFRRRLKGIQNQELDDMDLKKALDKIRAEFKSDTESLAQSEAGFSGGSASPRKSRPSSTYRRASQLAIEISLEDLRAQSLGARLMLAISRFFGRSKVSQADRKSPSNIEGGTKAKSNAGPQVPKTPSAAISVIQVPSTVGAGIIGAGSSTATVKPAATKKKTKPVA